MRCFYCLENIKYIDTRTSSPIHRDEEMLTQVTIYNDIGFYQSHYDVDACRLSWPKLARQLVLIGDWILDYDDAKNIEDIWYKY